MTLQSFMIIAQLQMFVFAVGALLSLFGYNIKDLYIRGLGIILIIVIFLGFTNELFPAQELAGLMKIVTRILTIAFICGLLYSLIRFEPRDLYVKLLGLSLLCSVIADFSAGILHDVKINVNYASSIYRIVTFPLISLLYFHCLGGTRRNTFIAINIIYTVFAVTNVVLIQKSAINTYTLVLTSILVIIFCLYYFYWLLKELPTSQLQRLPMFWINSAFIIYFSGNLFLFLFTSYLVHVLNNNLLVYWTIHNILGIIEGLMIVIALWLDLQNIKSPS